MVRQTAGDQEEHPAGLACREKDGYLSGAGITGYPFWS